MTQVTEPKKHQEFILAINKWIFVQMLVDGKHVEEDGNTLKQVIPVDFKQFCVDALPHLIISQRLGLENNTGYRQPIGYTVFKKTGSDGKTYYYNYNRAKGSGESRLLGGLTVGFGGHPDWNDLAEGEVEGSGTVDLFKTLRYATSREIDEELQTANPEDQDAFVQMVHDGFNPTALILSKDEKVGIYHFGFIVEINLDNCPHSFSELQSKEDAIALNLPKTRIELLEDPKLEDWTRLYFIHEIQQEEKAAQDQKELSTHLSDV